MTLAERVTQIVTDLKTTGYPVVLGPPFEHPPAAPCLAVTPPAIEQVFSTSQGCRIAGTTTEVLVIPATATDYTGMITMVDAVITAVGAQVTAGTPDINPFTDIDAAAYRLTLEE